MKKTVLTMMLLVGVVAMAQERKGLHRNGSKDLTPEQMATVQTKKMTLALDLTEKQQSMVKKLFKENAKIRKEKLEERKAMKEEGESKKPSAEERFAMQNEHLDRKIAHKKEMKEILSEEQYEKWEKMADRKHRKGIGECQNKGKKHSKRG